MPFKTVDSLLRQVHRLATPAADANDGELLERYVIGQDESAFERLI